MYPLQSDDLKLQDLANKGTIENACSYCKESVAYLCAIIPLQQEAALSTHVFHQLCSSC